jgi:hypothetical protein
VSGKTIKISGITIELDTSEFSETNNRPEKILAGESCTMKVCFTPTCGGGRDGIKKAIIIFDVSNVEAALPRCAGPCPLGLSSIKLCDSVSVERFLLGSLLAEAKGSVTIDQNHALVHIVDAPVANPPAMFSEG